MWFHKINRHNAYHELAIRTLYANEVDRTFIQLSNNSVKRQNILIVYELVFDVPQNVYKRMVKYVSRCSVMRLVKGDSGSKRTPWFCASLSIAYWFVDSLKTSGISNWSGRYSFIFQYRSLNIVSRVSHVEWRRSTIRHGTQNPKARISFILASGLPF